MADAVPAVAERRGAPERGLRLAAEDDRRMRPLQGLRLELDRSEGEEPAVELGLGLGPERAQRAHALARPRGAGLKLDPGGLELFREPADADPERQPAAREHVEAHREARGDERVPERQEIDIRPEPDA